MYECYNNKQASQLLKVSCVTKSLFWGGEAKGGQTFIWRGGQEDGIAMKGAQSNKSQMGANGVAWPQPPPIVTPLLKVAL